MAFKGGSLTTGGRRTGITAGFVGLGEYLTRGRRDRPQDPAQRVVAFGSNFNARDIEHGAEQMQAVADTRPSVTKPVYHFGLALSKDRNTGQPTEKLTAVQWEAVVDRTILELALEDHQVAWVVHEDSGHQHVHILANRVPVREGPTWRVGNDHYPLRRVARWTELEFGLSVHPNPTLEQRNRWTDKEFRAVRQEQQQGQGQRGQGQGWATFWTDAYPMFRDAVSWHDLQCRLAPRGFSVRPAKYHQGGLVISHSSGHLKALSKVHESLSGPRLADRFGESFIDYQARGMEPIEPAEGEKEPLTVDRLINHMEAHHAVWDSQEALREARIYPNGEEIVAQLPSCDSERLVRLDRHTYTTRHMVDLEEEVFDGAGALASTDGYPVTLSTAESLTPEHRQVIEHALGPSGLVLIQGPPGSGKTQAARVIAESYRSAGYEVFGTSVTGKASQGLAEATGLDSRTLASWRLSWEAENRKIETRGRRVMLVDEAGMLSLEDMKTLLSESRVVGIKLVMIGDQRQLPPVGAGNPFPRFLTDFQANTVYLTEVHRQQEQWMREATLRMASGDVAGALEDYSSHRRIQWTGTLDEARTALVMHWFEDRLRHPHQSSVLMAYRNSDVRAMNAKVRALRRSRGELDNGILIYSKEFAAGDRILFRRNDRRLVRHLETGAAVAVQNGTLGTVSEVEPNRLEVRLDSGTRVEFDPAEYGDIEHGYAVTLHKSQGVTVDRAYVLGDRHLDANGFVVAATRHRQDLQVYVPKSHLRDLQALEDSVSEWAKPDLIREHRQQEDREIGTGGRQESRSDPEKLEDLKKEMRSLYRKLHSFGARLPTAAEMARIEERLQALRESELLHGRGEGAEGWGSEQAEYRLLLRRMVERADLYRHQKVGAEAIDAAWNGREEDYNRALERFAGLAPVRLLPEPPRVTEEEIERHSLPDPLSPMRRQGVRGLEEDLARYRKGGQAAGSSLGKEERALREFWSRQGDRTQRRLRRALRLIDRLEFQDQSFEKSARMEPDRWRLIRLRSVLLQGMERDDLDLDRVTMRRPSCRESLESLQRMVGDGARQRTGKTGPVEEILRIHKQLRRLEETQREHLKATRAYRGHFDLDEIRRFMEAKEREMRRTAWDRLRWIYRGDPEAGLRKLSYVISEEGSEAVVTSLRTEPEVFGRLKGILKEKARKQAKELAQDYEAHFRTHRSWSEKLETQLAEERHLKELRHQLSSIPRREELLASLVSTSRVLNESERAMLPQSIQEHIRRLETEYKDLETEAEKHLKTLAHPFGRLTTTMGQYGIERAVMSLAPVPLRRVIYAAQSLRALKSNAPRYLLGRLLPRPLRMGLMIAGAVTRSVERGVHHDQGIHW